MPIYSINISYRNSDKRSDHRSVLYGCLNSEESPTVLEVGDYAKDITSQMTNKTVNTGHWPSAIRINTVTIHQIQ